MKMKFIKAKMVRNLWDLKEMILVLEDILRERKAKKAKD